MSEGCNWLGGRGGGHSDQKSSMGLGMDISWNNTVVKVMV